MNFRHLINDECGQTNSLRRIATHFTQDNTHQSSIGDFSTGSNFVPAQSFRMNDLMQEIVQLDSEGAARYPEEPIVVNQDVAGASAHRLQNRQEPLSFNPPRQSFNFYEAPPMSRIPRPMYFPPQMHRLDMPLSPQPEQPTVEFDKEKYIVVNSLEELMDVEEGTEEKPRDAQEEHLPTEEEPSRGEITKLIAIEFEKIAKNKKLQLVAENSIEHLTLLQKGQKLLAEGDTTGGILCFKDALKVDKTCVNAWLLLGIALMKDLQVEAAFTALRQGLDLEPHNLDIIMALAENYATDQNTRGTLATLLSWLINHPEYKDVVPENFEQVTLSNEAFHTVLINMLVKAAQRRRVDHDCQLQNALGLLFHLSRDYNKATDCFRSALQVTPLDPSLWNRLGITLGKLYKQEEAMNAFNYALMLDPAFVHAEMNIGLLWMNRKEYKEAGKHFLLVLNRKARREGGNIYISSTSTVTLNLLVMCISNMNRPDLRDSVLQEDLKILNREFAIPEI